MSTNEHLIHLSEHTRKKENYTLCTNNKLNEEVYLDASKTGEKYHWIICDKPMIGKLGNGGHCAHFVHQSSGENDVACGGGNIICLIV